MRHWLIDTFLGEPEEIGILSEIGFYSIMAMPLIIAGSFIWMA